MAKAQGPSHGVRPPGVLGRLGGVNMMYFRIYSTKNTPSIIQLGVGYSSSCLAFSADRLATPGPHQDNKGTSLRGAHAMSLLRGVLLDDMPLTVGESPTFEDKIQSGPLRATHPLVLAPGRVAKRFLLIATHDVESRPLRVHPQRVACAFPNFYFSFGTAPEEN